MVIARILVIPLSYMVKALLLVQLQMQVLLLVQLLQIEIWAMQVLQLDLELLCWLEEEELP